MNNPRRQALNKIIDRIDALMCDLESLKDEEEEYRDNIPENLQGSERYETADEAVDNLESAYDALDEVISYIEEAIG